jgi:uncharacterized membrane protein YhaH (DUF805 family)
MMLYVTIYIFGFVGMRELSLKGVDAVNLEQHDFHTTILILLLTWPITAVTAKRLNDVGWPVWICFALPLWTVATSFASDHINSNALIEGITLATIVLSVVIGCISGTSSAETAANRSSSSIVRD